MAKVTFVVDQRIDLDNHLISLDAYKRNLDRGLSRAQNSHDNLLVHLPIHKQKRALRAYLRTVYQKEKILKRIAADFNRNWKPIEKKFFRRLEEIHGKKFPMKRVKAVLSTASRFGYRMDDGWFAVSALRNSYEAIHTAMHELMHFMFHAYFDAECRRRGLTSQQMWDVKESFTVLLNLEFDDFLLQEEPGYEPHQKLRPIIAKAWKRSRDFNTTLDAAIRAVSRA